MCLIQWLTIWFTATLLVTLRLRLSLLHPLRPSHTNQSQGSKCVTGHLLTSHTQAKFRSPTALWAVGLEKLLNTIIGYKLKNEYVDVFSFSLLSNKIDYNLSIIQFLWTRNKMLFTWILQK